MLDYMTLDKKPTIKIGGETAKDLLQKTFNIDRISNAKILVVEHDYIARPDLISLAVYGDDKYADIICKANGLSNPFELNEGMILVIPSFESLSHSIEKYDPKDEKKKLADDKDSISSLTKIGDQKAKNEKRSPAEQIVGDSNYIIDRSLGVIFY